MVEHCIESQIPEPANKETKFLGLSFALPWKDFCDNLQTVIYSDRLPSATQTNFGQALTMMTWP